MGLCVMVVRKPYLPFLAGLLVLVMCPASGFAATGGATIWAKRYDPSRGGYDAPSAIVSSGDGSKVFVTGVSTSASSGPDYVTIAYDGASGAKLWVSRFTGSGKRDDHPSSIAVSPDGTRVYVTGYSTTGYSGVNHLADYVTIAYDASDGSRIWLRRYDGPGGSFSYDVATAMAVSPDGKSVLVTGQSHGPIGSPQSLYGDDDFATIAYDAATGATLWSARYNSAPGATDQAKAIAISPDGSDVFVTGESSGPNGTDYVIAAYSAVTGGFRWVRRYNGPDNSGGSAEDRPRAIAVTSDGAAVVVTGESWDPNVINDMATVAYDANSGDRLWVRRYTGPYDDSGASVVSSRDGKMVYVTGYSATQNFDYDFATVAYNVGTGSLAWTRRYGGAAGLHDVASQVVVGTDGSRVYVTGSSVPGSLGDVFTTIAYGATTGDTIWIARSRPVQYAVSIAVAGDGSRVVVAGTSWSDDNADFAIAAYTP